MRNQKLRMGLTWVISGATGIAILFGVSWMIAIPAGALTLIPVFTLIRG